jgi:hypothetical protein
MHQVPSLSAGLPSSSECEHCLAPTHEGKPMCPDHVHLMPYAAGVAADADAYEVEVHRLMSGEELTRRTIRRIRRGLVAEDVRVVLRVSGTRTLARIAHELKLEQRAIATVVQALVLGGEVRVFRRSDRAHDRTFVELVGEDSGVRLAQEHVRCLLPLLQRFAATGKLEADHGSIAS